MKITFVSTGTETRSTNMINGETFRYGGKAVSGTEQSIFIVAEQLVKHGHDVTVTMPQLKTSIYRGVQYIDRSDFHKSNDYMVDVVVIPNMCYDVETMLLFKKINHIVVCGHCQQFDNINMVFDLCNHFGSRLSYVHLSEWSKRACEYACPQVKNLYNAIIPNPLLVEDLPQPVPKQPCSFTFHASWERGGPVACRVVNKLDLPNKVLYRCDYVPNFDKEQYDHLVMFGGMDKRALFNVINHCEYFLYPLVLNSGSVHRDTHACCVAEAMALGAIVITYPIAALGTTYPKDVACWLELPSKCNKEIILSAVPYVTDQEFLSEEAIDNIVDQIKYLEAHPEKKDALRENARKFVIENFNEDKVGLQWKAFIESLDV